MNLGKGFKGSVNALAGLVLIALAVVGALAYFGDGVSVANFTAVALVAVVLMLVLAYFGWVRARAAGLFAAVVGVLIVAVMYGSAVTPDSGRYQAVFLTNGQVYFGKLKDANGKTPYLTEVYYLQSNPNNPQNTGNNRNNQQQAQLSLVKLGNELHGPEDKMVLKSDQILFWEDLKDDGRVVQAIKNRK